jgi:hypothetical protein
VEEEKKKQLRKRSRQIFRKMVALNGAVSMAPKGLIAGFNVSIISIDEELTKYFLRSVRNLHNMLRQKPTSLFISWS